MTSRIEWVYCKEISIKNTTGNKKYHQSGSREIRWSLIERWHKQKTVRTKRYKQDKKKARKKGMTRTGRGSKTNRMKWNGVQKHVLPNKKKTTCVYSSFIKSMYIVNVHNMYCRTVILVHCSALKDSYRNKRMKEQNKQKIGERYGKSKSEKMNSNEFDGWHAREGKKWRY